MKGEKFAGTPMVRACEKGDLDSVKAMVEGHDVEKTGMSVDEMLSGKERIPLGSRRDPSTLPGEQSLTLSVYLAKKGAK